MTEVYIYGIAQPPASAMPDVFGVEGGVRLIEEDGLAAIAGVPPKDGMHDLSRERALRLLLGHQEALEAALTVTTVLPVKFGTIAPHERAVLAMLRLGRTLLRAPLQDFSGCAQLEIIVSWQPEAVFAEIASDTEVMEARRKAAFEPGQATAVRLGQLVKAGLDRRRKQLHEQVLEALRPIAVSFAVNAAMDDRMAANLAVLIRTSDMARLDAALDGLDARFGGKLTFRCVGPLPPASFATLTVRFPSAGEVAQARQTLGLSGPANPAAVTAAYRRLAREAHPDLGALGAQSERMTELAAAQKLLVACAKSQALAAEQRSNTVTTLARDLDAADLVLIDIIGPGCGAPVEAERGAA